MDGKKHVGPDGDVWAYILSSYFGWLPFAEAADSATVPNWDMHLLLSSQRTNSAKLA
jgi:hypothetical protein